MHVQIEQKENVPICVAHLQGDVDMAVVPDIRQAVEEAISHGCSNVVLDLTDVHYADSSALGLLVWLDRRLEPYGGRLVLANADSNVSRVLELSGLVRVAPSISTASDVTDAINGLDLKPASTEPLWSEELAVPADIEQLARVRSQVCSLVETLGMPENGLFDLKVAVGEALANAVRHGSPDGVEDTIQVTVDAYEDRAIVTVSDRGHGFNGEIAAGPDVYASSGRGILFMNALMDNVEFDASLEGGTAVRLTKRLPAGLSSRSATPGGRD